MILTATGLVANGGIDMMKYESTRGSKVYRTSAQAIIHGLAEDKGLYVPMQIPKLDCNLEDLVGSTYQDIAQKVLASFYEDFTDEEIKTFINGSYADKCENPQIAPIIAPGGAWFLELYHAKPSAFKHMALCCSLYLLSTHS